MANVKNPQQIATETLPSTVLLEMKDSNGQPHGFGSGFFIREGEIATNFHVIEKAYEGSAKLFGQMEQYEIEGYTALDVENDLIILKIKDQDQTIVEKASLPLGDSDEVRQGETIYAVGNPMPTTRELENLEGTISDGIISGIRTLKTDYNRKRIQITAPISPGNSGGPVLNTNGEVVGVSVWALPSLQPIPSPESQETQYINRAQNLNFAIPSNYLKSLLQNRMDGVIDLWKAKLDRVVSIGNLGWIGSATYTFPLFNRSSKAIRNVLCEVNFKDEKGDVFERDVVFFPWLIPPKSAKMIIRLSTYDTDKLLLSMPELIPLLRDNDMIDYNESDVSKSPTESFLIGLADLLLTNMNQMNYSEFSPNIKRLMESYEIRVVDLEVVG